MPSNMNYKTQVVLDVLRRQIDQDYNFPSLLLRYDLDVFFFNTEGDTYPLPILDNTNWPPVDPEHQLNGFGDLLRTSTSSKLTEPNNMYTEFSHGYRLSHIVAQFAKALMHFNEEIVVDYGEDTLQEDEGEYVLHEPDDIERVIHQFAYFLASVVGATDTATVSRFIMQLSLFKRCEPSFTPFAMPPLTRHPLIGRKVMIWRTRPDIIPDEDLLFILVHKDKMVLNMDDLKIALLSDDPIDINNIVPIKWTTPDMAGVRLSEMVMSGWEDLLSLPDMTLFEDASATMVNLIADGLNKGTLYPVITPEMVRGSLNYRHVTHIDF